VQERGGAAQHGGQHRVVEEVEVAHDPLLQPHAAHRRHAQAHLVRVRVRVGVMVRVRVRVRLRLRIRLRLRPRVSHAQGHLRGILDLRSRVHGGRRRRRVREAPIAEADPVRAGRLRPRRAWLG